MDLTDVLKGETSAISALDNRAGVITESINPRWGKGTEFRMIRSRQYKYIARVSRLVEDLAHPKFDMETDPDEQRNLLKHDPDNADLKALREAVLDDLTLTNSGSPSARKRDKRISS